MCCAVLCCAMLCCAVLCAGQCHAWLCCSALGWCPPNGLLLLSCCFDAAYCSAVLLAYYCALLCSAVLRCSGLLCSALLCCAPAVLCCVAKMRCTPISCFLVQVVPFCFAALRFSWNTRGILHEYFTIFLRFARFPFPRWTRLIEMLSKH